MSEETKQLADATKKVASTSSFPPHVISAAKNAPNCKVDYAKMQTMGDISTYSCLMPWQIQQMEEVLFEKLEFANSDTNTNSANSVKQVTRIIDATAHIGGNTLHFASCFPLAEISAVELDADTFNCLSANVSSFTSSFLPASSRKIDLYRGDAVKLLPQLLASIESSTSSSSVAGKTLIFVDPPWGGRDYKEKKELCLYLGKRRVVDLCYEWLTASAASSTTSAENHTNRNNYCILLKVPPNFAFSDLCKKLRVKVHPIRSIDAKNVLYYFILEITL